MTGSASESWRFLKISGAGRLREVKGSAFAILGAEGSGGDATSNFCGSRTRLIMAVIKTIKAMAAAGAQIQRERAETAGAS